MGASCLPMLQLTTATHSSRCLEVFHCSSAMSGWWTIATAKRAPLIQSDCNSQSTIISGTIDAF